MYKGDEKCKGLASYIAKTSGQFTLRRMPNLPLLPLILVSHALPTEGSASQQTHGTITALGRSQSR